MSAKETRDLLIHAIAERVFNGSSKKILINEICESVGISRQSFNRYYGDLKPYLTGEKLIGELLGSESSGTSERYLVQNQETISTLESRLESLEAKHTRELEKVTDNYITTLMNNDITLWKVDETRATVERQNTLIDNYCNQIADLKLQLTNIETEKFNQKTGVIFESKILLEPNLTPAFDRLRSTGDEDKFESLKENELQKLALKASQYIDDNLYSLVLFLDLYLCNFQKFVDNHHPLPGRTYVYIRLPIYSAVEMRLFLKNLAKSSSIALYVPCCKSQSEKAAQRKFHFRNVPTLELEQADKAPVYKLEHGLTQVTHYTVAQGD